MKKKLLTIIITTLLVLAITFSLTQANGGAVEIQRAVCSGGGGTVSGGTVSLSGTLGQPVVGPTSEGEVSLHSGFWSGLAAAARFWCYLPLVLR